MKISLRRSRSDTESPSVKPKKEKALKPFKATRFILSVGDEGAVLTYVNRGVVKGRWFAPTTDQEHIEVFNRAVAADSKAPILILLDTIDQTFVQQNLPPVSKMSVNGLVKRRLKREFGNTELKSSYLVNRDANSKEWNYMLFAIEQPEFLKAWLAWVESRPNRCVGIRILPLEAPPIIETLYATMPEAEQGHEWKFLVSYNKVSGFRQIVLRGGKMIFTRLGQPLAGGPDVEAGLIEQEVISTLEYLKRMGLKNTMSLALIIIAGQEVKPLIDPMKIGIAATKIFTPHEAAQLFNLQEATQPGDRFGDIVLGVGIASLRKAQTVLWTATLASMNKLHQLIPIMRGVSVLLLLGMLYMVGNAGYTIWTSDKEISEHEAQKAVALQRFQELQQKDKRSMEELDKIIDVADVFQAIMGEIITPQDFFLRASSAVNNLTGKPRLQGIEWVVGARTDESGQTAETPAPEVNESEALFTPGISPNVSA